MAIRSGNSLLDVVPRLTLVTPISRRLRTASKAVQMKAVVDDVLPLIDYSRGCWTNCL